MRLVLVHCIHFGSSHFNAPDFTTNLHRPREGFSMADQKWIIGWCHSANLPWRSASNDYKNMREWACRVSDGNDVTGPVWAGWTDGSCCEIPWILGPFFEKRILPQKQRVDSVVRQLKDKGKHRVFSEKIRKALPKSRPRPPSTRVFLPIAR